VVIADTSVWIPFFNQPGSPEKREIDALIDADRLVLVGVVLTELMQGCRTTSEANTIISKLTGLRFLETSFSSWRGAGELSFALRRKGITLPLSDLVIAALALEHHCRVYTLDPHFEHIPDLALHPVPRPPRRR
jgi:predicted nucleic acid-binding protein